MRTMIIESPDGQRWEHFVLSPEERLERLKATMKCDKCDSENCYMEGSLIYCRECKKWSMDNRMPAMVEVIDDGV